MLNYLGVLTVLVEWHVQVALVYIVRSLGVEVPLENSLQTLLVAEFKHQFRIPMNEQLKMLKGVVSV